MLHLLRDRGVQARFVSILLFSIGTVFLKNSVLHAGPFDTLVFWSLIGLPLVLLVNAWLLPDGLVHSFKRSADHLHTIVIIGALVLFNSPGTPQFQRVSVPLVVAMGFILGSLFFGILLIGLRSQHIPVRIGVEAIIGKTGTAKTSIADAGQVQLGSELWSAEKAPESGKIGKGDLVEVVEVRGVRVIVKKK